MVNSPTYHLATPRPVPRPAPVKTRGGSQAPNERDLARVRRRLDFGDEATGGQPLQKPEEETEAKGKAENKKIEARGKVENKKTEAKGRVENETIVLKVENKETKAKEKVGNKESGPLAKDNQWVNGVGQWRYALRDLNRKESGEKKYDEKGGKKSGEKQGSHKRNEMCVCRECRTAGSVFLTPRSVWQAPFHVSRDIMAHDYMGVVTFEGPSRITEEDMRIWKKLYDGLETRYDFALKLTNDMLVHLVCEAKPGKTIRILNEYNSDYFSDAAAKSIDRGSRRG